VQGNRVSGGKKPEGEVESPGSRASLGRSSRSPSWASSCRKSLLCSSHQLRPQPPRTALSLRSSPGAWARELCPPLGPYTARQPRRSRECAQGIPGRQTDRGQMNKQDVYKLEINGLTMSCFRSALSAGFFIKLKEKDNVRELAWC